MTRQRLTLFLCGVLAMGCAAGPTTSPPAHPSSSETVQVLETIIVKAYTADEFAAEFSAARDVLMEDRYAEAAPRFDRLSKLTTDPKLGALALFNAGVAYEGLGERDIALLRHRSLLERFPHSRVVKASLVRMCRLLGHLERWSELETAAGLLLARKELPVMDRIEGLGALALARAERGDVDGAERYVNRARDIIEERQFGRAGAPPVQLAQVAFAEGEVRRIRSERIKLVPVPPNFIEVLEKRCAALLDAQRAYTDAMRSRDAHWSAMAGYRVGQMYQQLHREAMQIPAPADAADDKKLLFEGAMRLRYRILLTKGAKMMDATLRLAKRTGENSLWINRARQARQHISDALEDETAALAKLPFTEDEIRAALEGLKTRPK
jgi:tetratricopeptide (TPR) repeat protein